MAQSPSQSQSQSPSPSATPPARASQRELKRQYRETRRPMGVYAIRNKQTQRVYLSASLNLDAAINRDRFQLRMNGHSARELQAAWNAAGEAAFAFEVLARLKPRDEADFDYRPELEGLLGLWREDLAQAGIVFYALAPHVRHGFR